MAADVKIDIAAEFTGKKAFKQADTATQKLTSNVKKLAGAVGLAYGTSAIIAYGKASVKAFAADEAAARRLTTAVENLGIGFANPGIAEYIRNLEKSAAIADDVLRPAFQSLLTTTGSLTKSQELLNNAIQISRASGIDLATVSGDLAKGYVGVTRGLAKYNTGLTRAELQSKSFSDILSVMLARSAGSAEDYLSSTSYQMNVLSIATGNASEIIGGGLVNAFARIGGGTEASDAATAIETIATAIAKVTVATGAALGVIPNLIKNLKNLPSQIFMGFAGKQAGVTLSPAQKEEKKLTLTQVQQQSALAKLEAAAVKRNKELLALKNKQVAADKNKLAIEKAQLALGKGGNIFDMDAIQLAAAQIAQAEQLGKATNAAQVLAISNDIQRLNVKKSMYDLEQAIASGDAKAIEAATAKLNKDIEILGQLNGQKATVQTIADILKGIQPKALIDIDNLNTALALLRLIGSTPAAPNLSTPAGVANATANLPASVSTGDFFAGLTPEQQDQLGGYVPNVGADIPVTLPVDSGGSGAGMGNNGSGSQLPPGVTINVTTGIGDPNAIAAAIDQVLNDAVSRGTLRFV
jgi:hypothetical protein